MNGPVARAGLWMFAVCPLIAGGCVVGSAGDCTIAPPPPQGAASDWSSVVHSNCQDNLYRLGRWTGGTAPLTPTTSPANFFAPVFGQSLPTNLQNPQNIYIVVHGWAPGFADDVQNDPDILWWSSDATDSGDWASYWAWAPSSALSGTIPISGNGLFQQIVAFDPNAIVLGYSWIVDSATGGSVADMDEVYQSEAYTSINGIRLANALQEAINTAYWNQGKGKIQIIGHSHGSKVATVATLVMQSRGQRVDHLTILDAPESELPLEGNGANFLPFTLDNLTISPNGTSAGVYIDNYPSCFGVQYTFGSPSALDGITTAVLDPSVLWSDWDPDNWTLQHSYAAEWYAGAAAALGNIGLEWPPPPANQTPALNQTWPQGTTPISQWMLSAGSPIRNGAYLYIFPPLTLSNTQTSGSNVTFTSGALTMRATGASKPAPAWFTGSYTMGAYDYGVGFDFSWTGAMDGDYVVITAESPEEGAQETLMVLDGRSIVGAPGAGGGSINLPLSYNADASYQEFYVWYIPAANNAAGVVTLSNFQAIEVGGVSERRQRR